MEAAKALKYRPISAARTLRTRRSHLLALMVPYIETPFNPLFAAAVQREAEKSNLGIIIYAPRDDLRREEGFVDDCIRDHCLLDRQREFPNPIRAARSHLHS